MPFACILCLLLLPGEKSNIDTLKIYEHSREAIVRITATDAGGRTSFGSGAIVREDGVIVTDYRLIYQAASVRVQLVDGTSFDTVTALGTDPANAIVFLKVDSARLAILKFEFPEKKGLRKLLFTIGPPMELSVPVCVASVVSAPSAQQIAAQPHHLPLITFNSPLPPSEQGGPLLDEEGRAIGLIVGNPIQGAQPERVPGTSFQTIPASSHVALAGDYIQTSELLVLGSGAADAALKKWAGKTQPEPPRDRMEIASASKSVYVLVERGSADMKGEIEKAIAEWGGLSISTDPRKSDLVLLIAYSGMARVTTTYNPRVYPNTQTTEDLIEALASLRDASTGLEIWFASQRSDSGPKYARGDFSKGLSKKFIQFMNTVQHRKT